MNQEYITLVTKELMKILKEKEKRFPSYGGDIKYSNGKWYLIEEEGEEKEIEENKAYILLYEFVFDCLKEIQRDVGKLGSPEDEAWDLYVAYSK